MNKLILAISLSMFAIAATQADEAKPAKNMKDSGCCATTKVSTQAKAKSKAECSSCCKETKQQQVKLMSPKAAAEMGR